MKRIQAINLKNFFLLSVSIFSFFIFTLFVQANEKPSQSPRIVLDKIIATVNKSLIFESTLNQKMKQTLYSKNIPTPQLRKKILELLIDEKIQLTRAENYRIRIPKADLKAAIDQLIKNSKMSKKEFIAQLESDNMSFKYFKEQVNNELIINQLRYLEIPPTINITSKEIDQFLDVSDQFNTTEYQFGHILIEVSETASKEEEQLLQEKIQTIFKKLEKNPEKFQTFAKEHSQSLSAKNGGVLGFRTRKNLPEHFEKFSNILKKGEISKPFHAVNGFHILKLIDIKETVQNTVNLYHVRQIMISPNHIKTAAEAKADIYSIYKKLNNKADFSKLATQYSNDAKSTFQGGDIGWLDLALVHKDMAKMIKASTKIKHTKPFQIENDWYILQVLDQTKKNITQDVRREQARNILTQEAFLKKIPNWINNLKAKSYIKIFDF